MKITIMAAAPPNFMKLPRYPGRSHEILGLAFLLFDL